MKKTGKALSLVLSLALVVSSLATTFASAAVTKTEYLGATASDNVIDLVNGRSGDASKTDVTGSTMIPYSITGTTNDHLTVAGMTAQDVAMSGGQDLVSATIDSASSKIFLSLKDPSLAGSEKIAVRYTAINHRYTAPSADILFSAVQYYTVKVHKLGGYEISLSNTTLDKYGTVSGNKMTEDVQVFVKKYDLAGGQGTAGSLADPKVQPVTNIQKADGSFDTSNVAAGDVGEFFVKVSSSNAVSYTTPSHTVTATLTAPTGADFLNQGGLVAYAVQTTTDANSNVILDNTNTLTATANVANTITLPSTYSAITTWHGSTWAIPTGSAAIDEKSSGVQDPLNKNTNIPVSQAINVTNSNIVLGTATTMSGTAIVGDVTGGYDFTMNGGYAKSVALTGTTKFSLSKGTTGAVSASTVNVTGGTAGAVSATTATLDASDAKVPTAIGGVTAKDITIKSTNATVSTGAIKLTGSTYPVDSNAAVGGTLDILADKLSVPSIDFDHYNATLKFDGFTGNIPAPTNSENGQISVVTNVANSQRSNATITGAVNVKNVQLTEGALTIATGLNVDTISGAGTLTIPAGKMFVNSSITGISLKLSDAKLAPGMTAFSATAYKVYDNMFTPVGFTIDYDAVNAVTNRTTDVFKVKTVVFAGLTIAPVSGTSNKIVKGATVSFKATSYPSGTALPAGTKIDLSFNGSSDNFKAVPNGDTIAITANKYDDLFASLNKGTITATLVDSTTGLPAYNYTSASTTYDVQMITKPETVYTSDTTVDKTIKVGEQYTYKITSSDGSDPKFGFGTNGIANIVKSWKTTSGTTTFYYYTIQGVKEGAAGAFTTADKAKVNVVTVKGLAYKSDTSKVTIATGHHYTFKITADKNAAAPVFQVCTFSAKNTVLTKTTKNADGTISYEYTVTANGSPKGDHGAYVNGVNVAVVTVK